MVIYLVDSATQRLNNWGQERRFSKGPVTFRAQARNQDIMWGGANETKVDQTTEMYILLRSVYLGK